MALSNSEKQALQRLTLKAAGVPTPPGSLPGDDVYIPEDSPPWEMFAAALDDDTDVPVPPTSTGSVEMAIYQPPTTPTPTRPPNGDRPTDDGETTMHYDPRDGLPKDPRWRIYMQKVSQCCGIPLPCAILPGNVDAPTPEKCGAPGAAPFGCLLPIPFSKSIAAAASDTILIAPNQACVPAALDGSSSGIDIVLTDILGDNNNSLYTQGAGDIVTALILATAFGVETFWGKNNPFPRAAPRIDKTHGLNLEVTNGGGGAELASGILWAWVM